MKRSLIIVMCVLAMTPAARALTVGWDAITTGATLWDDAGTPNQYTSGPLLIQLVVDLGTTTVMSELVAGEIGLTGDSQGWAVETTAATDEVVDEGTWAWFNPVHGVYPETATFSGAQYQSRPLYLRWFDTSAENTAGRAGIIYNDNGDWVTAANDLAIQETFKFDWGESNVTGTVTGSGYQAIAPVPEPGTMALMALGLVTIGMRRKRRA